MRSFAAADRTVEARGRPTRQGEGSQRVGGANQGRVVPGARQRVESPQEQEVLRVRAIGGIGREALCGLDDDGGSQVEVIVGGDGVAVLGDRGDLREGIQGSSAVELRVDDGEGLDSGTELGGRAPHPFRDRANLAVFGGEQGDDAIRLAQFVGAQDDRLVTIGLHHCVARAPAVTPVRSARNRL